MFGHYELSLVIQRFGSCSRVSRDPEIGNPAPRDAAAHNLQANLDVGRLFGRTLHVSPRHDSSPLLSARPNPSIAHWSCGSFVYGTPKSAMSVILAKCSSGIRIGLGGPLPSCSCSTTQ